MSELGRQLQQLQLTQQQKPLSQLQRAPLKPDAQVPSAIPHPKKLGPVPATASVSTTSYAVKLPDIVPDIERPAGRTWKEQLAYDLRDEDDAASTSTLDHLDDDDDDDLFLGSARSMWDDWGESMWKRHEQEQRQQAEREDREVQEQIERMLEQDKQGLESLFDLDAINAGVGSSPRAHHNFKDDSNLLALDDDDDWSLPASSTCDPTERFADDDLLLDL